MTKAPETLTRARGVSRHSSLSSVGQFPNQFSGVRGYNSTMMDQDKEQAPEQAEEQTVEQAQNWQLRGIAVGSGLEMDASIGTGVPEARRRPQALHRAWLGSRTGSCGSSWKAMW